MNRTSVLGILLGILTSLISFTHAADRLVFEPSQTSGNAKHIVLVAGDEEYRTEETMPMLAKILSLRHGFRCTVIFSMGPDGRTISIRITRPASVASMPCKQLT